MSTADVSGKTLDAAFVDGPLEGTVLEVALAEGRPPSTLDVPDGDGRILRYALAEPTQAGTALEYSYVSAVGEATTRRARRRSAVGAATQAFVDMAKLDAKRSD